MAKITIVNKTDNEKQLELFNIQWRDLNNRLCTLLLSGKSIVKDDIRKKCRELDNLDYETRKTFINGIWGPTMLEKVDPVLKQLDILEQNMIKAKT